MSESRTAGHRLPPAAKARHALPRRDALKTGCLATLGAVHMTTIARAAIRVATSPDVGAIVNDIHSQLNETRVARIMTPTSTHGVRAAILDAARERSAIALSGGRHAMGGQQFARDQRLLDLRDLNRIVTFDRERGLIEVEAGMQWPGLIRFLWETQNPDRPSDIDVERLDVPDGSRQWGIIQKQTGADRLTIGGALSCNAHGRGLGLKPIVDNVEAFTLIDADGETRRCSRTEHAELFRLAIGGYGLFGVITSAQLRLWPRRKVQRVVEIREMNEIPEAFEQRIAAGYLYGDFQFATDSSRESFLRRGVFSTYRPVDPGTPVTPRPTRFHPRDWARLTYYTHKYKRRAFDAYSTRYLQTSGQVYWSDAQLSAAYVDEYHAELDRQLGARVEGSEMITEVYVPPELLPAFMDAARDVLRARRANVIYGTVRLIERDTDTFLAWAKRRYACIIFNLHIDHRTDAIASAADTFRALIDLARAVDGSYYLTYHRWATREQVEACYPQFADFLALKRKYDPRELFQSDWYRHYRALFGTAPGV